MAGWIVGIISASSLSPVVQAAELHPAIWAMIALLAAVLLVVVVMLAKYLPICIRVFLDTKMPMTADLGNGRPLSGEVHGFPSRDGTGLTGVFIDPPAGTPVRAVMVFAHEYRGDRTNAGRYTAALPEAGIRVFTFDFRGHGTANDQQHDYRSSHWVTDHEINDLLGAVAYVESLPESEGLPLGVMGVSRGACAAALTAMHTRMVRWLVLDGVFSTDLLVESLMRRWVLIFSKVRLAPRHYPRGFWPFLRAMTVLYAELKMRCRYPLVRKALIRLADVPVMFIWGQNDAYIEQAQRVALYRAKPGSKQLWEGRGAKHNQSVTEDPEGYRQNVVAFLDAHLPAMSHSEQSASPAEALEQCDPQQCPST